MSTVAIIADTHDQIANLRSVIAFCNQQKTDCLIHCGDLISPFMLDELNRFEGPAHLIYGNNPGDQHLISSRCSLPDTNVTHHGIAGTITVDGQIFCFVHYPDTARALAMTGEYDIVCYGHDHTYRAEWVGRTLLINPGHLLGKDGPGSFVLLDCTDRSYTRYQAGADMNDYLVEVSLG